MEIALRIIALGTMYVASNKKKTNDTIIFYIVQYNK